MVLSKIFRNLHTNSSILLHCQIVQRKHIRAPPETYKKPRAESFFLLGKAPAEKSMPERPVFKQLRQQAQNKVL